MKISLNWIKDYLDLTGIPVREIISRLTMSGLEVEDVTDQNKIYHNFIVGFVKEKNKHPNADKLSVCQVSTGKEILQVICGAPNVEAGQKVVFAPIGSTIPKGKFKINKAKIRGVESYGMICSEAELELSDNHEGIMILENELEAGTPITKALELNDIILEIAITPNRPDALSHFGVAREIAALFDLKIELPKIDKDKKHEIINGSSVEIIDTENCPRYTAKLMQNITVKESPNWLKNRLLNVGLRPINNIVDITNYVMYETGQPLHAFDISQLKEKKIIVKSLNEQKKFITLDSKERVLPAGTLMICDAEREVAVAGVMGGENSEINQNTKNILIESAYFNASSVRKTSKSLGLSTEASYRFERGTDPNITFFAAERTAQLIEETDGGEIIPGIIDVYPEKIKPKEIRLRFERIKKLLGYEIEHNNILKILENLGFKILLESDMEIHVVSPTFRPDIEREVDLIEEIARINGYEKIPTVERISITLGKKKDESEYKDKLRNIAISMGLFEMINNPLQSERFANMTGDPIKILNPQNQDMAFLRTSLIPGALSVVAHNINIGEKDLSLFEIGNVFNKNTEDINDFDSISEKEKLLIILTGKVSKKEWHSSEQYADFYILKGLVNSLISKISLDNVLNDSYYHNTNTIYDYYLTKSVKEIVAGSGGKIKKEVLKKFDIEQDVFCFEFDLNVLQETKIQFKSYSDPVKFPKIVRDFAFIFDKSIKYLEVKNFIEEKASNLLKSVELFDLFESESLGKNQKSMAFSLEYFSEERTLTEEEVEKDFNNLIFSITKNFNAKLRGSN